MGKFSFSVITEMDPHSRPKGYPHYQWIQCEEGEGLLNVDGLDFTVGPGQAMFLYPQVPHYYYPMTNPWKVHWFTFNGAFLPRILQVIGLRHSGVYSVVHPEQLRLRITQLFQQRLSQDGGDEPGGVQKTPPRQEIKKWKRRRRWRKTLKRKNLRWCWCTAGSSAG